MKRRAIISVYNKEGITDFAKGLASAGWEIISTGGTAKALREATISVTEISEVTGFPECLGGRVKSLHPAIFAGVLARRGEDFDDIKTLQDMGLGLFDLVCVNFYPFGEAVARGKDPSELIEFIDIGGPSLVRAAAKNHGSVTVVVDPNDYGPVLDEILRFGDTRIETRRRLMVKAFAACAAYDCTIAEYFSNKFFGEKLPPVFVQWGTKSRDLRYGENPHQKAAVYCPLGQKTGLVNADQKQGKVLSYNNFVDMEAAWALVREFDAPAVAIIKHTNPCGCAVDKDSLLKAYEKALATDPVSAFGGIVACNREVDAALASRLAEHFFEVVLAPRVTEQALEILHAKKNLRVIELGDEFHAPFAALLGRAIAGGLLVQEADPRADELRAGKVVTKRQPTPEEWEALDFAWRVCKHVKSNAIVFARADRTVGIGAGQMSRVDAAKVAVMKALDDLKGTVVGSDAFFPFPDGVEVVAEAGATAIAQPGGSVRDEQVIETCDRLGLAMVFTGRRHFKH